ncbi:MAG: TIGR04290 family methyltransferase [Chitinispirillaceae bacterium]
MGTIEQEIRELRPWFHNLHLPDGIQTVPDHPLGDFPLFKWRQIEPYIPGDLDGWNVLDIGCNAGFYSIELARRGARVTAIDIDEHYLAQARWAAGKFGVQNQIDFRLMQVYDLSRMGETFDLVWFMGVFYHLRYPLLALDVVSRRTEKMMVFQTLTMPGEEEYDDQKDIELFNREVMLQSGWPKMAFIEKKLAGDPTNWWAPNHGAIEAMLRSCGFMVTERPAHETYICKKNGVQPNKNDLRELEFRAASGLEW